MSTIKSYLGAPVVVVEDLPDGTTVVTAAEVVSTGDLYEYALPGRAAAADAVPLPEPVVLPVEAEPDPNDPDESAEPQPVTYSGPERRTAQRRSGVERRQAAAGV